MFDSRQLGAEFLGTFALVSAVCGAGLFSAPSAGLIAVAFAVGLSVVAMAYAVGSISGAHFNPAVTLGLVAAGRFNVNRAPGYIIAQLLGGAAAAAIFWFILSGLPAGKWNTFTAISNIAAPTATIPSGLLEVVITALFIFVIVSVTGTGAHVAFAPIAIGLSLVLFHLIAIPVTNASLNPARSTATALFGGPTAVQSLWLFWVAPILGGLLGGVIARWVHDEYPRSARRKRSRR